MFDAKHLLLYAITDRGEQPIDDFLEAVDTALQNGVTLLQLREKELSDADFIALAKRVKELCDRHDVPLIINDRVDVALAVDAAGVHVGIDDEPVETIRAKVPADFVIGATAKTPAQAREAARAGANYLGVGAVFPSPTKATAIRITHADLKEITGAVAIPSVAIGGISKDNVMKLKNSGISGIAVVSSIFKQTDIAAATRTMLQLAEEVVNDG